jgi:hypothetical protein
MNGTTKRVLAGFTALVLAPLAALQASAAVKVAVCPELARVMREIITATAARRSSPARSSFGDLAIRNSSRRHSIVK